MESLYKNKEEVSSLSLRFEDVDKFWILDTKVPLSESKGSNNGRSTVIDTIDNKNFEITSCHSGLQPKCSNESGNTTKN